MELEGQGHNLTKVKQFLRNRSHFKVAGILHHTGHYNHDIPEFLDRQVWAKSVSDCS